MKAITITKEIKEKNIRILKNATIGTVKEFEMLPELWTNKNGNDHHGFHKMSNKIHQENGFFDVKKQTVTKQQRLIPLIPSDFDEYSKEFINRIEDFTQAEIDQQKQDELDNDESSKKISKHRQNGRLEHKRIWDKIMRLYDNGQLNENQFSIISDLLFDALLPLEIGLWKVSKSRVDALPTGSGILETIREKVKEIIDLYVLENY